MGWGHIGGRDNCAVSSQFVLLYICNLGAPCDNFQGYCDVFQKCRGVDADGPLARLKDLLFSEETFNEIKDWIMVSDEFFVSLFKLEILLVPCSAHLLFVHIVAVKCTTIFLTEPSTKLYSSDLVILGNAILHCHLKTMFGSG